MHPEQQQKQIDYLQEKLEQILFLLGGDMSVDEYVERFGGNRLTIIRKLRKNPDMGYKDAGGKWRIKHEYLIKLRKNGSS